MFVNGSGPNKHSLWTTFHRCFLPSFGSFGQAVSEEKISKNRPIRNKNCLWRPCLLMDQDEMSNLYRGLSIDASYQVSVHLAEGFQRRRLKCEKLTDNRRRMPIDGKSSHCLWRGELKKSLSLTTPLWPVFILSHKWFSWLALLEACVLILHRKQFNDTINRNDIYNNCLFPINHQLV